MQEISIECNHIIGICIINRAGARDRGPLKEPRNRDIMIFLICAYVRRFFMKLLI